MSISVDHGTEGVKPPNTIIAVTFVAGRDIGGRRVRGAESSTKEDYYYYF